MKNFKKTILIVATSALFSTNVLFAKEWYENYENAKKAIAKQRWEQAVNLLNRALGVKSKPSANAKTYGLRFIDYFPYLYRGVAKYHLGDFAGSKADLKNSEAFAQVQKAKRDRGARKKLEDYFKLLAAQQSELENSLVELALQKASELTDQKKYEEAVKILKVFLDKNPLHQEGRRLLRRIEGEVEAELERISDKKPPPSEREYGGKKIAEAVESPEISRPNKPKKNDKIAAKKDKDLDQNFQEGLALFEAGDLKGAKLKFNRVSKTAANYLAAIQYLQKINTTEKQTREGVASFFEGNNTQSIKMLNEVLIVYRTNPNVQAFLGSAYATEYFLSGEEDEESLQKALTEFDNVKKLDSNYRLDSRLFSPRILELFARAPQN